MAADQADTIPVRRDTAVLAGNFGVGKTSLFHRLTGTAPGTNRGSAVLRLQNGTRIQLMDTCDMERFENKSLTVSYYRDAACVLLVADASDARSVQSLQNWRDSAGFYAPRDADGILLSSIESYQQRLGCCYSVVTSTKTGQGIDLLRDRIGAACRQFRRNTLQLPDQHRSFQLQREPSRQSSTAAADDSPQKSRCGC
uniref:Small monomeric GTPase n=1 Tax=Macrostomum lignano TaxID=282301 RepID=A0A1I8J355_9PLAT